MTQTERELLEALKAVLQWIDDNCETTGFETVEAQADAAIVKAEAHRREDMTNDIEQLKREICAVLRERERILNCYSPDDTKVSDFNGYPDLAVCCGS